MPESTAAGQRVGTISLSSKPLPLRCQRGDQTGATASGSIHGISVMARASRIYLPLDRWPAEDRARWQAAFKEGDRFDESGPGAHLKEATRRNLWISYARFLSFIAVNRPDLLELRPEVRIDRVIVVEYVAWRAKSGGYGMAVADLDGLRGVLRLFCPAVDWSWLLTLRKRVATKAARTPRKYHLVTSDRLYALGIELMDRAIADAKATYVSKAHAFEYRDGLVIALLALVPLRSRTLVTLRIGKHLVKTGDLWGLDIPAADTKTRRPLDYPISQELSTRIDLYLQQFRRLIPGADTHTAL